MKKIILSALLLQSFLYSNEVMEEKKSPFFETDYLELSFGLVDTISENDSKSSYGFKYNKNFFNWLNINTGFNYANTKNEDFYKTSYISYVGVETLWNISDKFYLSLANQMNYIMNSYTVDGYVNETSGIYNKTESALYFSTKYVYNKIFFGLDNDFNSYYGYEVGYEILNRVNININIETMNNENNFIIKTQYQF